MVGDEANQLLCQLLLADPALANLARLALEGRGQGATAGADAVDVDNHFPMGLAVAAVNALKPCLYFWLSVGGDVKAAFERYRRFLERTARLEMLV
jgi:hypothetical protein